MAFDSVIVAFTVHVAGWGFVAGQRTVARLAFAVTTPHQWGLFQHIGAQSPSLT